MRFKQIVLELELGHPLAPQLPSRSLSSFRSWRDIGPLCSPRHSFSHFVNLTTIVCAGDPGATTRSPSSAYSGNDHEDDRSSNRFAQRKKKHSDGGHRAP